MPSRTTVAATIAATSPTGETDRLVHDITAPGPSHIRSLSYGTTTGSSQSPDGVSTRGKGLVLEDESGLVEFGEMCEDELSPIIHGELSTICARLALIEANAANWIYMSRFYLLVPIITTFFLLGLVLLVTFAWYFLTRST